MQYKKTYNKICYNTKSRKGVGILYVIVVFIFMTTVTAVEECKYSDGTVYTVERINYMIDNYGINNGIFSFVPGSNGNVECANRIIKKYDVIYPDVVNTECGDLINAWTSGQTLINTYYGVLSSNYYSKEPDLNNCRFPLGQSVKTPNYEIYCAHYRINASNGCIEWVEYLRNNKGYPFSVIILVVIAAIILTIAFVKWDEIKKYKDRIIIKRK